MFVGLDSEVTRRIIESYLKLSIRQANRCVSKCPFHAEKTPSFTLFLDTGRYYCFGCKEKGDAVSFLKKINGWSFTEVCDYLRRIWGIEQEGNQPTTIFDMLNEIGNIWNDNLKSNRYVFQQCINLGFTEKELLYAGAGFSDGASNERIMKAYPIEDLRKVGLINDGGNSIVLNQRLIFPLYSTLGKVIGFQGRSLLKQVNEMKYITNRNTEYFKKSSYIYGLNWLRKNCKEVIIVEGIKDAIKLNFNGFSTIALLGSAVTEEHLLIMKDLLKYRKVLYIMLDGDQSGLIGCWKIANLLKDYWNQVKICNLTDGDPADYCERGVQYIESAIYDAKDVKVWIKSYLVKEYTASSKQNSIGKNDQESSFLSVCKVWFKSREFNLPAYIQRYLIEWKCLSESRTRFPTSRELYLSKKVLTCLRLEDLYLGIRRDLENDSFNLNRINVASELKQMIERFKLVLVGKLC